MAEIAKRIMADLVADPDLGLTPAQAAGFVGNFAVETGNFKHMQELNPTVKGSRGGWGWAQWTGPRRRQFEKFAMERHLPLDSYEAQYGFLKYELLGPERAALERVKQTSDPYAAALAVMQHYERPGVPHASKRTEWAGQYMAMYDPNYVPPPMPTSGTQIFTGDNPYSPYDVLNPWTDQDRIDNPALNEDPNAGYTFWEGMGAAQQSDWTHVWAARQVGHGAVDPDFVLPLDEWNERAKSIPQDYHSFVLDAHSREDFEWRVRETAEDMERERKFANSGLGGIAGRLVANVLDPTALVAAVGTEGALAPVIGATKVSRLGRILTTGAAVGVENAIFEAGSSLVNPKIDGWDVAAAAGIGMFLGGTIGALRRGADTAAEGETIAQFGRELMNSSANVQPGSVGAARSGERSPLLAGTPMIDDDAAPRSAFGAVRFDAGGQLGSSDSPLARTIAAHIGEEAVGFVDGSVVPTSATVRQRILHGSMVSTWHRSVFPAFKEWAIEKDAWGSMFNRGKRDEAWAVFNRQVAEYVEDPVDERWMSPAIRKAGQAYREVMGRYADLIDNPLLESGGVGRPIMALDRDPHYVAKYADHERINDLLERFDKRTLEQFIEQAALSKYPDMDINVARRFAAGYLDRLTKAGYGMEDGVAAAIAAGDRQALKEALEGFVEQSDIDEVFKLVDGLGKPKDGSSGSARTKRRSPIDYRFTAGVRQRDGTLVNLNMSDFFHHDADFTLNRYSRQMSGRVAMAQMQVRDPSTGELIIDGIRSNAEFEKLLSWVRDDHARINGQSHGQKAGGAELDVQNLTYLWDTMTGTPHYNPRTKVYEWMRRLRDLNFIRLMNRMGITQSQEFARAFGSLGLKAMMKQMPALRRIIDDAGRSVPHADQLLQELEAATGRGTEMDFGRYRYRYDEELTGTQAYGKVGRTLDGFLEKGKRITADISLMTHVHSVQQKWVMKAVSQRLFDMAERTGRDGEFNLSRLGNGDLKKLRSIGLGDADLKAVFGEMLKHGTRTADSKLTALNMDKWDPELRAKFVNTMFRWTDRIIHVNDAATLNRWMSQPIVQMMTQFRSFVIGSWAKSTLYNIKHFDARTFATMMLEMAAGAATYALVQAGQHAGDKDSKTLEERLSWDNLARAGFSRAGWSSLLPPLSDTGLKFAGIDPIFDYRTSGTATDFWLGSPTVDMVNGLATFTGGAVQSVTQGRELSQAEIQAGVRSMPFGNFLPFSAALSYMISDRDRYAPRD